MSNKERLHELVENMPENEAAALLAELEWVPQPLRDDDRTAIDRGRAQARDGQSKSTEAVFEGLRAKV